MTSDRPGHENRTPDSSVPIADEGVRTGNAPHVSPPAWEPAESPDAPADGQSTFVLLERAKGGDRHALDVVLARYLPALRRWARGRLPRWARDMRDTDDLVQDTVFQTLKQLHAFEPRREGALHAYLRQALVNRIRDELRRAHRHPLPGTLDTGHEAEGASPLEEAVGREAHERYEAALARLRVEEREAIIARVELGLSFAEVASALGKSSADSARKAVARALVRLAEEMQGA